MSVKEDELLEEISGFLHGYLKAGKVKLNSFISKMNTNISNIEQLLTIRFLLREETKEFVKELPTLIKRFKTTTILENETYYGEVRGQIDWAQTIKERVERNPKDKIVYSINENIRSYNTPENLVLKELLRILYNVLFKDNYIKGFENREWFAEWQGIKSYLAHTYKKNIYLQRVDSFSVSDRIIEKTLSHRNKLYRNAAKLLASYRKLMNGKYSEQDIKNVLQETFIAPDKIDLLFELYWVIQLIKSNTDESQLHLMDGSQNLVASWDTESYIFKLYHDSTGSGKVKFSISIDEISDSSNAYLNRKYQSFTRANILAYELFGRSTSDFLWQGRPDFLLEVSDRQTSKIVKIIIGEVKNTSRIDYAITGLEELLDYLHLVKDSKGDYILGGPIPVHGLLCVGDVPIKSSTSELIKIAKYKESIMSSRGLDEFSLTYENRCK
ncbi:hypothetical protein [Rossellomorea sp. DUT-2]|uniref:hypothetical protein n=1 Tax=Rossellomorea sp. DUT-2 TaxID=3412021 RepID=UPI003D165779